MFLNRLCSGVSMIPFDPSPQDVLDLGCGSGLWAIEAAKTWPVSSDWHPRLIISPDDDGACLRTPELSVSTDAMSSPI